MNGSKFRRTLCVSMLAGGLWFSASENLFAQPDITTGTELVVQGALKDREVNLRADANAQSAVVVELTSGTRLTATGRSKMNGPDRWIEVRAGAKVGWVHSRYVRTEQGQPKKSEQEHSKDKTEQRGAGPASADPIADCDSVEIDRRLRGCTALIQQAELTPAVRAVAYSRRSDSYIQNENFNQAISDRAEALRLAPDDPEHKARLSAAYHLRGLFQGHHKRYETAIADFGESIKYDEGNHLAFEARGLTFIQAGRLDKAIEDLATAIRLDPSNKSYAIELASAYEQRGSQRLIQSEFEGAISDYTEAMKLVDQKVSLFVYRGDAYLRKGDKGNARADYDKVLELEPDRVDALVSRGQVNLADSRFDAAIADFSRVLKAEPKNVEALLFRAIAYERGNRLEDLIADYGKILKFKPKNDMARKNLKRLSEFRSWQVKK